MPFDSYTISTIGYNVGDLTNTNSNPSNEQKQRIDVEIKNQIDLNSLSTVTPEAKRAKLETRIEAFNTGLATHQEIHGNLRPVYLYDQRNAPFRHIILVPPCLKGKVYTCIHSTVKLTSL